MQNSKSVLQGNDGHAYQIINGQSVRVSDSRLMIPGYKPLPETITVDGLTFLRDENGNIFLVENGQYIPLSEAEIQKLNIERFGGQLEARLQQEIERQQGKSNYVLYAGINLIVLFLITR